MEVSRVESLAFFLVCFPGVKVNDHGTFFWYDESQGKFFYQRPENKKLNGVYEAGGLASAYRCWLSRKLT